VSHTAGNSARTPQRVYINQLATMKERELKTLYVNFEHLVEFNQVRYRAYGGCRTIPTSAKCIWLRKSLPFDVAPPTHTPMLQELSMEVVEAFYRLEPYLREAVRDFVRAHLDSYAETDEGEPKEFWVSFYNMEVRGVRMSLHPPALLSLFSPRPHAACSIHVC
jgi:hypothetical protein